MVPQFLKFLVILFLLEIEPLESLDLYFFYNKIILHTILIIISEKKPGRQDWGAFIHCLTFITFKLVWEGP